MDLAHDDRPKANFYFACQPRNNLSKFAEYLVPALQLTAILALSMGSLPMKVSFVWPFKILKRVTS